jgi:hypothetical protein
MAMLFCDENAARVRESAGLEAHDHALAATVEVTQDRLAAVRPLVDAANVSTRSASARSLTSVNPPHAAR